MLYLVLSLPMRNWNEIASSRGLILIPRFEPTYEELKHLFHPNTRKSIENVLSLPMRNWNPHKEPDYDAEFPFWAYLWGIETKL